MSRDRAPEKVTFLMHSADGLGGVARTVVNLANELSRTRPVEMISVRSGLHGPTFIPAPAVTVRYLDAIPLPRTWGERLRGKPARTIPPTDKPDDPRRLEPELERAVQDAIAALDGGVLITTRPSLHRRAVAHARPEVITIGQEHLNFPIRTRNPQVMAHQRQALDGLDALVVLTRDDRADYEAWAPEAKARIVAIPNGTSFPMGDRATLEGKVAISAGRFARRKGFPRLVQAWAPLVEEFPDWQLHIYGKGPDKGAIRAAIREAGVGHVVKIKPYSSTFDQVLLDSSLYLMGSTYEGFPMVLVEAMSKGLPLIAFDCPRGPADIIEDGVNGRLVGQNDVAGFTEALRQVLSSADMRRSMGAVGYDRARDYEMPRIAARWSDLFAELRAARG